MDLALHGQIKGRAWKSWFAAVQILCLASQRCLRKTYYYNLAITGCGNSSYWQLAVQLVSSLHAAGLACDDISIGAATNAIQKVGRWERCFRVLSTMGSKNHQSNAFMVNTMTAAASRCGQWQLSLQTMQWSGLNGVHTESLAYNSGMNACEKSTTWTTSLGLLSTVLEGRVQADVFSMSTCISACSKAAGWKEVACLLLSTSSIGIRRDLIACNAAMTSLSWEAAFPLLSIMKHDEVQPDIVSFGGALSSQQRQWHRALLLLDELGSCGVQARPKKSCSLHVRYVKIKIIQDQ